MSKDITRREKLKALYHVAEFRPRFTVAVVTLSGLAAMLEGIGLSFVLPIIELSRTGGSTETGGMMELFVSAYDLVGVPLTLESAIVGVSLVITARYTMSFLVSWLRSLVEFQYVRHLRASLFERSLDAWIGYFDTQGSDDILNAVITQTEYVGQVIQLVIEFIKRVLVSTIYIGVALYIAPLLTLFAATILGGTTLLTRTAFESGYSVGDRIADANERIQQNVQAGIQGIREVKLFGMSSEIRADFSESLDQYVDASVREQRNSAGIDNFHQLLAAVSVFVLIYLGLEFASLSIGKLGVFLFAMFRLSPRVSALNDHFYRLESNLPHLVRSQRFIEDLDANREPSGERDAPDDVKEIEYDGVSFAYEESEQVLENVTFDVERGEFVGFVGQSGAGKSTIVLLLARMYDWDDGEIRVNGTSLRAFDPDSWRDCIAVVRQSPYIFDQSLYYNITVGNRDATRAEVEEVARIARIDEFLNELPEGYDTLVGDDGVRLSGGQKQRVALARALLEDADVLILDEATSDLDTSIEAEVHEAIENFERDYITITIAHRLSTVRNADRIYTVEDGRITDVGTHGGLLERGGKYAELYADPKT